MPNQPSTLTSERLRWIQNHPVFSILIVCGIVVIAISSFTDGLDKIRKFVRRDPIPLVSSISTAPVTSYTPLVPAASPELVATPKQSPTGILSAVPSMPATTPSEAERIVAEVSAARPLQRRKVALTFVNIPVDWKLYFSSGDAYERLTILHFVTSADQNHRTFVRAEVFTEGHEDLALLDEGTPIRVRGKIEYIDGNYIRIKAAQVERWPNP